jgi:hypothetical protein
VLPQAAARYAQLCCYRRSFETPTQLSGSIVSLGPQEARHSRPFVSRLWRIIHDESTTPDDIRLALAHAFEAYAVKGLPTPHSRLQMQDILPEDSTMSHTI